MAQLEPDTLEAFIKNYTIPIKPEIKTQLRSIIKQDDPDMAKLSELIGEDVSASSAIFQIINSRPFATKDNDSITDAIENLGLDKTRKIIEKIIVKEHQLSSDTWRFERFWDSARQVAILSTTLAEKLKNCDPKYAYFLGLFRDCGIPLMMQALPKYAEILKSAKHEYDKDVIKLENEKFYINHQAVGYCISRYWKLPEIISFSIFTHHDLDLKNTKQTSLMQHRNSLVSNLYISELVASRYQAKHRSYVDPDSWPSIDPNVCQHLQRTELEIHNIMDQLYQQIPLIL